MLFKALRLMTPASIKERIPGSVKRWLRAMTASRQAVTARTDEFNETATDEDVYYCYRLLLGRLPDPDGRKTYEACVRAGQMSVHTLALSFLSSPEFRSRAIAQPGSRSNPVLVDLGEFKMYVLPDDFDVGRAILADHTYEPHVTTALKRHLGPAKVFVDLGANVGYFSLMAAPIVGAMGRVVSVDPIQIHCSLLLLSAHLNGFQNIDVYPLAVAERKTTVAIEGQGSHGSIADLDGEIEQVGSRTLVTCLTVDDVLRDMERVDIIKMDIEGAEFRALEGATRTVRGHRPIIFSEFSPAALKNVSNVSGEQYLQTIIREAYDISVIGDEGRLLRCGSDTRRVMRALERAPLAHIDIVAHPR